MCTKFVLQTCESHGKMNIIPFIHSKYVIRERKRKTASRFSTATLTETEIEMKIWTRVRAFSVHLNENLSIVLMTDTRAAMQRATYKLRTENINSTTITFSTNI